MTSFRLGRPLGPRTVVRAKFALDLAAMLAAVPLAYALRLESLGALAPYHTAVASSILALLPVAVALELRLGLHRQIWRRVSFPDLAGLAVAALAVGATLALAGLALVPLIGPTPRSVPLLAGLLAAFGLGLPRLGRRSQLARLARSLRDAAGRPTLIVGAGEAGAMIARELERHPEVGLVPVGFADDDPSKRGRRVAGLPVLGSLEEVPSLARRHRVAEIVIAAPSSPLVPRRVFESTRGLNVRHRVVPGLFEILGGQVSVNGLRDVRLEDLLGRPPVPVCEGDIGGYLEGRTVLVTGAGGSIGSQIVRGLARYGPRRLVLLGRGENSVFGIERELEHAYPELDIESVILNVQDPRLARVFERFRPEVVFHAAAHKHVPFMEANPGEAVLNNVFGTRNVVELCLAHGVRRLVNVSTDKAVNPTSVMGASKRVAEMIVSEAALRSAPHQAFVSVRFGNVLGSRGSVVPLFLDQIRRGGPLTVTDPEMRRYFMTIPEAAQLVLQAGGLATNGYVYVLDMGEPVRIADLAANLIRLSGAKDIEIRYTGARPGEKLYEELLSDRETNLSTAHEMIFVAPTQTLGRDLLERHLGRLKEAALADDPRLVRQGLGRLVPEYAPPRQEPDAREPAAGN